MSMWLKPEWFINMSTLLIFSLLSIRKKLNSFLRNRDNFFVKIKLKKAMGFAFQLKYKEDVYSADKEHKICQVKIKRVD